jgi:hypothetical protein
VGLLSTAITLGAVLAADAVAGRPARDLGILGPTLHLVVIGTLAAGLRAAPLAVALSAGFPAVRAVGEGRSVRAAVSRDAGRRALAALSAVPLSFAVGTAVGVVAFVPALATYAPLATLGQAAGYSLGFGVGALAPLGILGTLLPVLAAAAVAAGAVFGVAPRVADPDGPGPVAAVREGVAAFAAAPARAFGHGLSVSALFLSPLVVTLGVAAAFSELGVEGPTAALVLAGVAAVTAVLAYAVGPVYRAAAAGSAGDRGGERGGRAADPGSTPTDPGSLPTDPGSLPTDSPAGRSRIRGAAARTLGVRTVVLALVASGLVLGATGAARVADVGPAPSTAAPGYDPVDPPDAAVEAGIVALSARDRVVERTVYRASAANGSQTLVGESVVRLDADDREAFVATYTHDPDPGDGDPPWRLRGSYTGEAVELARLDAVEGQGRPPVDRVRTARGGWQVRPSLEVTYGPSNPGSVAWPWLDDVPGGTFRVVASGPEEVVVETRSVAAYRELRDLNPDRVVEGGVRVVLDADTGYPERVVTRRVIVDTADDERRATRAVATIDRRPVDVTRPPGAPAPGLLELAFDALVY